MLLLKIIFTLSYRADEHVLRVLDLNNNPRNINLETHA